ncbi:hypothetical protein GBA52_011225 [Prunus armeniaca]|nr:hypothetical protein GBA52_011225 [Prunus armeniaca]
MRKGSLLVQCSIVGQGYFSYRRRGIEPSNYREKKEKMEINNFKKDNFDPQNPVPNHTHGGTPEPPVPDQ